MNLLPVRYHMVWHWEKEERDNRPVSGEDLNLFHGFISNLNIYGSTHCIITRNGVDPTSFQLNMSDIQYCAKVLGRCEKNAVN